MLELAFLLLGLGAFIALIDWKRGLALSVVTGLLQDPMRKMVDGQPVYFVVLVGVVFGAAVTGALLARERMAPKYIVGWSDALGWPFSLFVVVVLAQAVHSLVRFESFVMTGIGLLVWLAPVLSLGFAYRVALRLGIGGIERWMMLYCFLAVISLSGVYFEYGGKEWAALGQVGEGMRIYDIGTVLKAYAGFFRSSEIAAWHTATTACLVFMLLVGKRVTVTRFLVGAGMVAAIVGLGILTGRRKLLVEIVIFMTAYFTLVIWYQRNQGRRALMLVAAGLFVVGGLLNAMEPDEPMSRWTVRSHDAGQSSQYQFYALRGQSVVEDIPDRIVNLGFAPISWAVDSLGWFGSGLGTGSQGTGGEDAIGRNIGAAEGGLGKIVVELGVPGLLIVCWLALAIVGHVHRILRSVGRASSPHFQMACGFLAILLAKTSSFAVAAQAYSDLFILLLLGSMLGFVIAIPALIQKEGGRSVSADRDQRMQWSRPARQF